MARDIPGDALRRIAGGDPASLRIEEFGIEQCIRWYPHLQSLLHLAAMPGSIGETRSIVRRLRARLDREPDIPALIDVMTPYRTPRPDERGGRREGTPRAAAGSISGRIVRGQ